MLAPGFLMEATLRTLGDFEQFHEKATAHYPPEDLAVPVTFGRFEVLVGAALSRHRGGNPFGRRQQLLGRRGLAATRARRLLSLTLGLSAGSGDHLVRDRT